MHQSFLRQTIFMFRTLCLKSRFLKAHGEKFAAACSFKRFAAAPVGFSLGIQVALIRILPSFYSLSLFSQVNIAG